MNAHQVKQHLSEKLRSQRQFVSASVRTNAGGKEYVLIRLLDEDFDRLCATVPSEVGNVEIRVERSGPVTAFRL